MKIFLLLFMGSAALQIPMKDLPSCIKARDAIVERNGLGHGIMMRRICVTEDGDTFEKEN